jgi:type II secretion system protein N
MSTEIKSLDLIDYKFKIKKYLLIIFIPNIFILSFLSYFPISGKLNDLILNALKSSGCPATFTQLDIEFLLPKVIISDLAVPQVCTGAAEDLFFKKITINYHLISFSPFGIPFKADTRLYGQDLSLHYVLGLGKQSVRLKDQKLDLSKLAPLFPQLKLKGSLTVDMRAGLDDNTLSELTLKASSSNFELPGQNIQGFALPHMNIKDLFIDIETADDAKLKINKFIIGGANQESPIRANFVGNINLSKTNTMSSQLALSGEVKLSEGMKQSIPLLEMMLENYAIKDGFYQLKIGGTLGAPTFK